jgi:hypothetical protein
MTDQPSSYLSRKINSAAKKSGGNGIFAAQPLKKGEVLAVFGGVVYEWETFITLPEVERSLCIQVEDNLFLVPRPIGSGDYVNHSCTPNAGLLGQIGLVAMRDITIGEEICFDYAMCDTVAYDEFPCSCGSLNCRNSVTGSDWQLPELQNRYKGFFAPHVQRKIDALKEHERAIRTGNKFQYQTNPKVLYE